MSFSATSSVITERAIVLYNEHVVPRMTTKNKVIGISVAVAMSLYYLVNKALKPPKKLRHIRYVSPITILRSVLSGETYWNRAYRIYMPMIDDPKNHDGLYLVIIKIDFFL